MNMGVNLVEILSLFASSLLVAVGIGWCFGLCGAVLILSAVLCQRNREIRFNLQMDRSDFMKRRIRVFPAPV